MSNIKFTHLQVGQQFEYQGAHYTKVAPLIASNNADGKQRMIPRSALVSLPGGDAPPTRPAAQREHPALAVVQRYHQTVLAEMQSLGGDEARLGAARSRLEALREELTEAIRRG